MRRLYLIYVPQINHILIQTDKATQKNTHFNILHTSFCKIDAAADILQRNFVNLTTRQPKKDVL